MNDPVKEIRKKLEAESSGIIELINKHSGNSTMQKIGQYIGDLQTLVEAQNAQMSVKRYVNENTHNHTGTDYKIQANNYRPEYQRNLYQSSVSYSESPPPVVYYKLSEDTTVNASKINYIRQNIIVFDSKELELSETESKRLQTFIKNDFL